MDKKGRKKLAELAVNGDTDAFSKLYGEIYKELYYYALANLQNAEERNMSIVALNLIILMKSTH